MGIRELWEKIPAHILLGIAVLLFGLGLTLLMQAMNPGVKETCPEGVICTEIPVQKTTIDT